MGETVKAERVLTRRELMRRAAAAGLVLPVVGGALAACGGSSDGAGDATSGEGTTAAPATGAGGATGGSDLSGSIVFMKPPHLAGEEELQNAVIEQFNQQFPNVEVQFRLGDWSQYQAQLATAYASGSPPDVTYQLETIYPQFALDGVIENLSPYVTDPGWQENYEAFVPQTWSSATFQGDVWGVPSYGAVWVATVNLDLLAEAGVTDWNSSYEALREAAISMTTGDRWGFLTQTDLKDFGQYPWIQFMHNAGANIFDEAQTGCGLVGEDAAATMQFLVDLHQKDKVTPPVGQYDLEAQRALFRDGKVGIYIDIGQSTQALRDEPPAFEWDIDLPPPGPVEQSVVGDFGFLCLASGSENKEAAWEFMKFWVSAPIVTEYARAVPLIPARTDVEPFADNPTYAKIQTEFVPRVQGFQVNPKMSEVIAGFYPTIERAYRGELSGADALAEACSQIDQALA